MIEHLSFALAAPHQNLGRLVAIRFIVLTGQFLVSVYCYVWLNLSINYAAISAILLALTVLNILTHWRVKKTWPITDLEFLSHLLLDILGLSLLLYLTGGANNPFVSYYLVPITISAALLPWRYTWITSTLSLGCYTLLLYFYFPLAELNPAHGLVHSTPVAKQTINLHISGMWLNFTVSAVLITYFVVRMAQALRDQREDLNAVREEQLRDEQILAVATLAAGTAHELGTPLSTMAVLLKELENDNPNGAELLGDISLLQQQVALCKKTLGKLTSTADNQHITQLKPILLDEFLNQIIEHWKLLRPQVQLQLTPAETSGPPLVELDTTVEQAIMNLLNNAADASPERIMLSFSWTNADWTLVIRDFGPGIPLEVAEYLGQAFVTTKGKGLGIGLMLTHASIARLKGTVKMYNHPDGGTMTELQLPLATDT